MKAKKQAPIAVFTAVGQRAQAQRLARVLVEQRLVASAQISAIESFYVWDDAVQHKREFRLLCKTTGENYQAVEEIIRKHHPYDLPAIYACPFERVYAPYADWIAANSAGL